MIGCVTNAFLLPPLPSPLPAGHRREAVVVAGLVAGDGLPLQRRQLQREQLGHGQQPHRLRHDPLARRAQGGHAGRCCLGDVDGYSANRIS